MKTAACVPIQMDDERISLREERGALQRHAARGCASL